MVKSICKLAISEFLPSTLGFHLLVFLGVAIWCISRIVNGQERTIRYIPQITVFFHMVLSYLANEMQIQVCAAIPRWFTYQNHFTVVFSHIITLSSGVQETKRYGFPSPFHKIHDPIRIMAKCQHLCYYWYVIWLVVEPPL